MRLLFPRSDYTRRSIFGAIVVSPKREPVTSRPRLGSLAAQSLPRGVNPLFQQDSPQSASCLAGLIRQRFRRRLGRRDHLVAQLLGAPAEPLDRPLPIDPLV